MIERAMEHSRPRLPALAPLGTGVEDEVVYGITAVRYEGGLVAQALMGLFDLEQECWVLRPAPTRVVEVVDRLVEGDTVITLYPTERGTPRPGPQIKVDVLPEGTETLVLEREAPGRRLSDLPRF